MLKTRTLVLLFLLLVSFTWLFSSGLWKRSGISRSAGQHKNHKFVDPAFKKLQAKAADAKLFVQQKKYNENICFLLDMSPSSGQYRFFVYDLNNDSVRNSGLVTHGNCYQYWLDGRKYDNTIGSGCTSLGKYKVGRSYNGRFGLAFKLYGL